MKGLVIKGFIVIIAVIAIGMTACIEVDNHDAVDSCLDYNYVPVREWVPLGPGSNFLDVGIGYADPFPGCGWFEEVSSWDTLYLDGYYDYYLMDLRLNYVLTNWGNYTTRVWVDLCAYGICDEVIYIDLLPGEQIWDRAPNPVLDTAMADFNDCYNIYGDYCRLEFDIDVYVGEECTISPVTLDYYYDGLYVY